MNSLLKRVFNLLLYLPWCVLEKRSFRLCHCQPLRRILFVLLRNCSRLCDPRCRRILRQQWRRSFHWVRDFLPLLHDQWICLLTLSSNRQDSATSCQVVMYSNVHQLERTQMAYHARATQIPRFQVVSPVRPWLARLFQGGIKSHLIAIWD